MNSMTHEDEKPMRIDTSTSSQMTEPNVSTVSALDFIPEENAFWYHHPSNKKYKLEIPDGNKKQWGNIRFHCRFLGL